MCSDIPVLGPQCGTSADTIQVAASISDNFFTERLLLVNNVGADSDNDGIIDRIEAVAPGGDTSNQVNIASYIDESGAYTTIEAPAGIPLQSIDVLGFVY